MKEDDFKIRVIADITCDIEGSIPSTIRATTIDDPFYDFQARFKAEPEQMKNYRWGINGNEHQTTSSTFEYTFENNGVYDVSLVYEDENGCKNEIAKPVSVQKDFDPAIQKDFTPNNNDGRNDEFMPKAFTLLKGKFRMEIYANNGDVVFKTNSVGNAWNGKRNNTGEMMPEGIYVWKAVIQNEEGIEKPFSGQIRIRNLP